MVVSNSIRQSMLIHLIIDISYKKYDYFLKVSPWIVVLNEGHLLSEGDLCLCLIIAILDFKTSWNLITNSGFYEKLLYDMMLIDVWYFYYVCWTVSLCFIMTS